MHTKRLKLKMDQETKLRQSYERDSKIFNLIILIIVLVTFAFVAVHENRLGTLKTEMVQMKHGYERDLQNLGRQFADFKRMYSPSM